MDQISLSPKQVDSLKHSHARLNIWQGAVRSGKTYSSLIRFIEFMVRGPPGDFIIAGRTDRTVKRNVITPIQEILGNLCTFSPGNGELKVGKRTCHLVGASDERAEGKIRGITIAGAYVDEITIIPESFFSMLLSRLSITGAKLFGSTNPDGPYHWLKTNFLDRQDEIDLKQWHFDLDDNPSLDPAYIHALKSEYTGLWYKRFIEGLWVLAEGTIYDFFDERKHVIKQPPAPADYYIVGVDYGTHNPCVFTLIGVNAHYKPSIWLEKEYYYDSRKNNRQKTDAEYSADLKTFLGSIRPRKIYIDPSAASFKVQLQRDGFLALHDAENKVIDGIRVVSRLLASEDYKICACCHDTLKEISQYSWDPKAAKHGIDAPIKDHDHALDSARYALFTHFGERRFDISKFF